MGKTILKRNSLDNKRIPLLEGNPDAINTLGDLLTMCDTIKISSFKETRKLLESQHSDIAILAIMGIDDNEVSGI